VRAKLFSFRQSAHVTRFHSGVSRPRIFLRRVNCGRQFRDCAWSVRVAEIVSPSIRRAQDVRHRDATLRARRLMTDPDCESAGWRTIDSARSAAPSKADVRLTRTVSDRAYNRSNDRFGGVRIGVRRHTRSIGLCGQPYWVRLKRHNSRAMAFVEEPSMPRGNAAQGDWRHIPVRGIVGLDGQGRSL